MIVIILNLHYHVAADELKNLVCVEFSEEGHNIRSKEEAAWNYFGDFLDECEGKTMSFHKTMMLYNYCRI